MNWIEFRPSFYVRAEQSNRATEAEYQKALRQHRNKKRGGAAYLRKRQKQVEAETLV